MNILEKLLHIQSELKAPKNQRNDFGKYNYRNCEDIQEAVKPLAQEVKAVLVTGDELVQMGDRFYVKATARFMDCESSDEIKNTAYAREESEKKGMDASQITGSASSYARKYALNGLFCIDDVKDADSQDNTSKGKADQGKRATGNKQSEPPKPSKKQLHEIYNELARTGIGRTGLLKKYNITALEVMSVDQYNDAISALKSKPNKPVNPSTIPPDDADNGLPWK
ncbi:ERF family protein [Clostridium sp. HBUAS56010]|uniref:ERF family protein n=1 Tax=Clostridium sp. HBUAS56010 TaxID=2571127 RepID=UPI0011778926|nr:ERF family protein [Clostridium sp. HBUAS56010]